MWRVWGRGEVHTGFGGRLGVGGILVKWILKKKWDKGRVLDWFGLG